MFDAFMKFDGIKGESLDAIHKGEINVVKFNWVATHNSSGATGGGSGKSVQDFQFTHQYDLSSPLLFQHCVTGTRIKEADFSVRRTTSVNNPKIPEFLKIKFTDVLISSVNPHGNTEQHEGITGEKGAYGIILDPRFTDENDTSLVHTYGDELPLEDVSLTFTKVDITYLALDPGGLPQGAPTIVSWDINGNTGPSGVPPLSPS